MKISCWITRAGEIHECDFAGHFCKAAKLGFDEEVLEETERVKASARIINCNFRHC